MSVVITYWYASVVLDASEAFVMWSDARENAKEIRKVVDGIEKLAQERL